MTEEFAKDQCFDGAEIPKHLTDVLIGRGAEVVQVQGGCHWKFGDGMGRVDKRVTGAAAVQGWRGGDKGKLTADIDAAGHMVVGTRDEGCFLREAVIEVESPLSGASHQGFRKRMPDDEGDAVRDRIYIDYHVMELASCSDSEVIVGKRLAGESAARGIEAARNGLRPFSGQDSRPPRHPGRCFREREGDGVDFPLVIEVEMFFRADWAWGGVRKGGLLWGEPG